MYVYFIFSKLIFAWMVAIIICYSNTQLCFFFDLSFVATYADIPFKAANLLNIYI